MSNAWGGLAAYPREELVGCKILRTGRRRLGSELARWASHARLRHRGAQNLSEARSTLQRGHDEFAAAETRYRRALASRPDDVNALWKLSRALEGQAHLEEAEQFLLRARELAPSDLNVIDDATTW